jgi:hypothetical protein
MRGLIWLGVVSALFICPAALPAADAVIQVAVFEADITPPLGAPLCDALVVPAKEIVDRLKARGVVLLSGEKPIVLCACDWVGIGNSGYDQFREALAQAAARAGLCALSASARRSGLRFRCR